METNRIVETEKTAKRTSTAFPGVVGRWIEWIVDVVRDRIISYEIIAGVAYYAVLVRTFGLGRSLWLDEAWEANAIIAPSARAMFYDSSWLPTCPPLFLILVRIAVGIFGLSNWVFRIIPSLMGLLAALLMAILAARILSKRYAIIATTLFVLSPPAVMFSRTLKQYSGELAFSTAILLFMIVYLQRSTRRNFWTLGGVIVLGLLFSYPVAFLLPGAVLAVFFTPAFKDVAVGDTRRKVSEPIYRAIVLTVLAGGTLVAEYLLFLLPNAHATSLLRTLWGIHNGATSVVRVIGLHFYFLLQYLPLPERLMHKTMLMGVAAGGLAILGLKLALVLYRNGERIWLAVQLFCLLPCLLLLSADLLKVYPMVERTGLFLLPFVVILLVSSLELTFDFALRRVRAAWPRKLWDVALVGASLLVLRAGVRNNPLDWINKPLEDLAGSVSFLRQNVHPDDIVWVHASTVEGFKFYARMTGWKDAPAKFGNVGWPCCPRGVSNVGGARASTEGAVRADLSTGIPESFSGRVWLLYTERPEHWASVELNEPQVMGAFLKERGCSESATPTFHNVGVSSFDCGKRH